MAADTAGPSTVRVRVAAGTQRGTSIRAVATGAVLWRPVSWLVGGAASTTAKTSGIAEPALVGSSDVVSRQGTRRWPGAIPNREGISSQLEGSSSSYRSVMTSARERVAGFWDEHVSAWLAGKDPMPDPLPRWFDSYPGRGLGEVTRDGFPEPYAGDLLGLLGRPRIVILGLNPGIYHPRFQARHGVFAEEIRQFGAYSTWMATAPYLRPPWTRLVGRPEPLLPFPARLRPALARRPHRAPHRPTDLRGVPVAFHPGHRAAAPTARGHRHLRLATHRRTAGPRCLRVRSTMGHPATGSRAAVHHGARRRR